MPRRTARRGFLLEHAALARIEELCRTATSGTHGTKRPMMLTNSDRAGTSPVRQMWARGDYHTFATATVWPLGQLLVDACGVAPGQRVLDVAAGTGNVALRAAQAGATVVASDLTPEHFESGRRAAAALGVSLDWIEADAASLPFPDGSFDVVTSCVGAIFAPDHVAAANEMLRVCRPGGVIGMINFKPEGLAAEFFELLGRYAPSPQPGSSTPLQWGNRSHVEALFADRVESLDMTDGEYIERSGGGPDAYRALFERTFGPVIAIRASLAAEPERLAAFDRSFREFTIHGNHGAPDGRAEYSYPYLLMRGRKRAS
jgi:2-polyprenyl-6-hydroxyphenyl methylase/3-demethylubiquinone-9 3-methyltransferase